MRKPAISPLLAAIRQFGNSPAQRPQGEGWHTLAELAAEEGVTVPAIQYRLNQAKRQGVVIEQTVGSALDRHGKPKRAAYYRLKNGKP